MKNTETCRENSQDSRWSKKIKGNFRKHLNKNAKLLMTWRRLMFSHLAISAKHYRRGIYYLKFIYIFKFRSEGSWPESSWNSPLSCLILNFTSFYFHKRFQTNLVQNRTRENSSQILVRIPFGSKLENIDKI